MASPQSGRTAAAAVSGALQHSATHTAATTVSATTTAGWACTGEIVPQPSIPRYIRYTRLRLASLNTIFLLEYIEYTGIEGNRWDGIVY